MLPTANQYGEQLGAIKDRIKIAFDTGVKSGSHWRQNTAMEMLCTSFAIATNGKYALMFDRWLTWSEYPHTDYDIGYFRIAKVIPMK